MVYCVNEVLNLHLPCSICGERSKPRVIHHWYQPDEPFRKYEAVLCMSCNRFLSSDCPASLGDHLFKDWQTQVEYVQSCVAKLDDRILLLKARDVGRRISHLESWRSIYQEALDPSKWKFDYINQFRKSLGPNWRSRLRQYIRDIDIDISDTRKYLNDVGEWLK